jgi:hypothetical protein
MHSGHAIASRRIIQHGVTFVAKQPAIKGWIHFIVGIRAVRPGGMGPVFGFFLFTL